MFIIITDSQKNLPFRFHDVQLILEKAQHNNCELHHAMQPRPLNN